MQKNSKSNHKQNLSLQKKNIKFNKPKFNGNGRSLLQKISNNLPSQKQNQFNSGKLIITKLNDYNENKCHYGANCAHLRAQAKCQFLHQKKDFEYLHINLPQKYLQNQQPLKKSKQQRKQDKIKQKAERQKRLQQKLDRQTKQQKQIKKDGQNMEEQNIKKDKNIDQKQLLIQQILKTQKDYLSLQHIYQQLNKLTDAYCKKVQNKYTQNFNLKEIKISMHQVRKRLILKLKKNKQYEAIHKKFIQKQESFIKKLIKNILAQYPNEIQQIKQAQKCQSLDLRQIYQNMEVQKINLVLRSKKQFQSIIEYYSRFFNPHYGYPISFQIDPDQTEQCKINKGNILPLKQFHLLTLIAPNFQFQRIFVSINISYSQLRAISQFSSLVIPQRVQQKEPVRKTITIDIMNMTYTKFCEQIMTQYLLDYHQKLKPAGQFTFGNIEQNLKKMRVFLNKYKSKVESDNKLNSFVLVIYNLKDLLKKIEESNIGQNLSYESIKKDRTINQQSLYQKIFLLKEFIKIIGQNKSQKLKIVYINNGKRLKLEKYTTILQFIDEGIKQKQQKQQQMQVQV